jgi:hypothetical protein
LSPFLLFGRCKAPQAFVNKGIQKNTIVFKTICKEGNPFNYQMTEKPSKIKGFRRF